MGEMRDISSSQGKQKGVIQGEVNARKDGGRERMGDGKG